MTKARDNANNWAADITGVTAGTGITGGGTSGAVTVTNELVTTIDAAGDLLYGTGSDAATRLAIGTAGQVLAVNTGETAPEWVTPAAGGFTQLATGSLTGASITISSISQSYKNLFLVIQDFRATSNSNLFLRLNNDSTGNYGRVFMRFVGNSTFEGAGVAGVTEAQILMNEQRASVTPKSSISVRIDNYTTISNKNIVYQASGQGTPNYPGVEFGNNYYIAAAAITRIDLIPSAGDFESGTFTLYGEN
jgi:hypothetical protein